jgi:hypothetical protein
MFKVQRAFTGEWFNATPRGRTRRVFSKAMKLLNRLLIIVTIVGLAAMLIPVRRQGDRIRQILSAFSYGFLGPNSRYKANQVNEK